MYLFQIRPFNSELVVDWAEQQDEPDEETMNKVGTVLKSAKFYF